MNDHAKRAIAAVAVIALVAVGSVVLRPSQAPGVGQWHLAYAVSVAEPDALGVEG